MYQVDAFREERIDVLHALMRVHPLAALVSIRDGVPEADHLPLLFDPEPAPHGALLGHVARGNPLARGVAAGSEVLAVFQGPQAYVTPSWYPGKREHGKVVPTWNYAVVHAYGVLNMHEDRDWLHAMVSRLTLRHEAPRAQPWAVDDAPADYVERMLGAIVGIEIRLTRVIGKWKVSQNRSAADRAGVAAALGEEAAPQQQAMAALVAGKRTV